MSTATISIFYGFGRTIELKEVNLPELKEGEILVRITYATLCRSDLNTYSGRRKEKTPTILGHEIVGRIEAFGPGEGVRDERGIQLKTQDLITWAIYASDPESELAKLGIPQKGDQLFKYGHEQITSEQSFHGGLATHIILRQNTPVVKVSEKLPLPVISIINCAVATVAGAIRLAGGLKDKRVLISGAGMLGVVACAMSRSYRAGKVIVTDVDTGRLDVAERFGADAGLKAGKNLFAELEAVLGQDPSVDVVLEFSGAGAAMEDTLAMLRTGGTVVWVGGTHPQKKLMLDPENIIRKLITIKGLHNYTNHDLLNAVEFIEGAYHDHPFEELITKSFQLEQVNEAFAYALEHNPFRVGIDLKQS